jgi:hypothetical protein
MVGRSYRKNETTDEGPEYAYVLKRVTIKDWELV